MLPCAASGHRTLQIDCLLPSIQQSLKTGLPRLTPPLPLGSPGDRGVTGASSPPLHGRAWFTAEVRCCLTPTAVPWRVSFLWRGHGKVQIRGTRAGVDASRLLFKDESSESQAKLLMACFWRRVCRRTQAASQTGCGTGADSQLLLGSGGTSSILSLCVRPPVLRVRATCRRESRCCAPHSPQCAELPAGQLCIGLGGQDRTQSGNSSLMWPPALPKSGWALHPSPQQALSVTLSPRPAVSPRGRKEVTASAPMSTLPPSPLSSMRVSIE